MGTSQSTVSHETIQESTISNPLEPTPLDTEVSQETYAPDWFWFWPM